jgi:hypothetical protein
MALFGAPVAIEDGPLKACRAALEIQQRLTSLEGEIEARHGVLPKFRIGIHTGPLIVGKVGDDQRAEITALGDTVNLAARLESEAEPGGILLSEATHRLAEGFVAATFAGEREVKGKIEAQRVYSLDGLNEAVTRFDVSVSRGLTALVGRTDELDALERAWADVNTDGFRMVDLIGEAGIGKSRLVHDFLQRLDDNVLFLQGRCLSSGTMTPFLPFIEVTRSSFRIADGATRIEAARRLERGLETLGLAVDETLPYLLNLLGHEVAPEMVKTVDSEAIGVRTRHALLTLLNERRRVSPVILFIDDLHWMDNASEELLGRICGENRDLPLLLICAYRPGYAAPWRSREGVQEFRLDHLSPGGTEEMLRSRLGADEIPDDLARLVAERAQGNPLFAEEIIGYLIERGAVSTTKSGITFLAEDIGTLPVNLENLLMDRFDRLAAGPRRVLETAAVIGTSFQPALIEAVAEEDVAVNDALSVLDSQGLVLPDEGIEDGLRFKHILVREAIYDSLLAPRREALHARIGAAIERTSGADSVDILAHHYSRANNPAKAVHFLSAAGEKSLIVYSLEEASSRFRDAIQRIENNPGCVEDSVLVDILLKLARILYFRIEFHDIIAMVERYLPVVERLGDQKRLARFLFETGYAHVFCARGDVGRSMLERALAIGEDLGDDEAIGYASLGLMWHYMYWCPATPENRRTALDLSETAFAAGEKVGDVWLASKALLGATLYFSVLGRPDEGRRSALRLMQYGRTTNDPRPQAPGHGALVDLMGRGLVLQPLRGDRQRRRGDHGRAEPDRPRRGDDGQGDSPDHDGPRRRGRGHISPASTSGVGRRFAPGVDGRRGSLWPCHDPRRRHRRRREVDRRGGKARGELGLPRGSCLRRSLSRRGLPGDGGQRRQAVSGGDSPQSLVPAAHDSLRGFHGPASSRRRRTILPYLRHAGAPLLGAGRSRPAACSKETERSGPGPGLFSALDLK